MPDFSSKSAGVVLVGPGSVMGLDHRVATLSVSHGPGPRRIFYPFCLLIILFLRILRLNSLDLNQI